MLMRLSVMVSGREFQTRGAMHAKPHRANVVRDRGRLRRLRAGPECARWFVRMKEFMKVTGSISG